MSFWFMIFWLLVALVVIFFVSPSSAFYIMKQCDDLNKKKEFWVLVVSVVCIFDHPYTALEIIILKLLSMKVSSAN
jgi:hypothetical protein